MGGRSLTVAPYYECLGAVPPGMGLEPCWKPPTITVDFDRRIVQFASQTDAVRSRIEASLRELSPGCSVTWPDSAASNSGAVQIAFAGASNTVSSTTASKTCRDRLDELLGTIEAGRVDILQEIWSSFIDQYEERFREVGDAVAVEIDRDNFCIRVVGERPKCPEMIAELGRIQSALVDELRRSETRISERITTATKCQLSLLQACGFLQADSADDDLSATVSDNAVVLEGQTDKVVDRKMKMLEMLALAQREMVRVDGYDLAVLEQEPFRRHLDQLLQGITGVVWGSAGKEIEVYGESSDKVSPLLSGVDLS